MGWNLDRDKVSSQWKEFGAFMDHARNDEPAGIENLLGRPFRPQNGPPVTPQPHATTEVNYYILQVSQLYEAGIIDQRQYNAIVQKFNT